jgi:hypothetical protein
MDKLQHMFSCRKQITPEALPVYDSAVETEYTCVCVVHSGVFIPIHFLFETPMRQVENANEQIATGVFCRKQITTGALPVCDSAVETECTRVCVVHSDVFIPIHFLFKTPMRQVENANATCETRMDP